MKPYYRRKGITLYRGKVEAVLPQLAGAFDACLCDPPYGLAFMGKSWDHGVPGVDVWSKVLRALKPGAPLLAFGGSRTHHRLMCAIEDAGFEIRDCLMWLYGSGFPKSLDISKAIDKAAGAQRKIISRRSQPDIRGGSFQNRARNGVNGDIEILDTAPATDAARQWEGYGTALKPAWEPIILAMNPCDGTFAQNARRHGVAGLAIDAGRIETAERWTRPRPDSPAPKFANTHAQDRWTKEEMAKGQNELGSGLGRWPANVILDEESAAMLDRQSGILTSGNNPAKRSADKHRTVYAGWKGEQCLVHRGTDSGGASRFFYCAKSSRKERGEGNTHPTVKPLKLTEYLTRLILPPKRDTPRRLLIPFSGSGSEILGALAAGWDEVVGIELNADYCEMTVARLEKLKPAAFKVAA